MLDQRVCFSESLIELVSVLEGLGSNVTRSFDLRVPEAFSIGAIASRPWLAWRGIDEEVNLDPIDLVSNLISTVSNMYQLLSWHYGVSDAAAYLVFLNRVPFLHSKSSISNSSVCKVASSISCHHSDRGCVHAGRYLRCAFGLYFDFLALESDH